MSRSRTAFLSGTITDNPLTNVATTINSAALASLPAIASPDIAVLVLDPTGSAGAPEVVYVTAHTGSATSATISRGQEGSSARQHASGIAWVHGPTTYDLKGWRLEGQTLTEATSTNTSATDMLTVSGLLIPATQAVRITGSVRKSTGATGVCYFGLKINSTVTCIAGNSALGGYNVALLSNANEVQSGGFEIILQPRNTNYLRAGFCSFATFGATGGVQIGNSMVCPDADMPTATITSITITGRSGSASITIGVRDVSVEVLDT